MKGKRIETMNGKFTHYEFDGYEIILDAETVEEIERDAWRLRVNCDMMAKCLDEKDYLGAEDYHLNVWHYADEILDYAGIDAVDKTPQQTKIGELVCYSDTEWEEANLNNEIAESFLQSFWGISLKECVLSDEVRTILHEMRKKEGAV